ncbi:cyclopropane-fatty-acyl-phospholipid synthase family protein [Okeania sp. SIO1I7]|uniref:SAM-dependent methyltransferase n=1 Tax=Okeania sp. SIO1I7 TaxID=2607772 RepID=UPI0025E1C030|nr:methionine biosynthesis protein MetW [Okeania sp. SIO1I7]
MLFQSGITKDSRVLDLGCGNGNTAIWLSQETGCEVVGDDNPAVREVIESFSWSLVAREEFNIFDTEAMYAMVLKKD